MNPINTHKDCKAKHIPTVITGKDVYQALCSIGAIVVSILFCLFFIAISGGGSLYQ